MIPSDHFVRFYNEVFKALEDKGHSHIVAYWRELGRIQSREWNDKEGNKRRTTEIIASQMVMLGSRQQGASSGSSEDSYEGGAESGQPFGDAGITDSDIPF